MATIAERTLTAEQYGLLARFFRPPTSLPVGPPTVNTHDGSTLSAVGNPAPLRAGLMPTLMTGSTVARLFPDSPQFRRRVVANPVTVSTNQTGTPILSGTTLGAGNGASGNLSAPAYGSGSGPVSGAVVTWVKVTVNNATYWQPLFQ